MASPPDPLLLRTRLLGLVTSVVAAAILGVALWLEPEPAGHGTHEQLGLLQCNWITLFDFPCPTCGMTTAFAHAVGGNFAAAFMAQPAGLLLAIATAGAMFCGLYVVVTAASLGALSRRVLTARFAWIAICILAMAWVFKILTVKGLL